MKIGDELSIAEHQHIALFTEASGFGTLKQHKKREQDHTEKESGGGKK